MSASEFVKYDGPFGKKKKKRCLLRRQYHERSWTVHKSYCFEEPISVRTIRVGGGK